MCGVAHWGDTTGAWRGAVDVQPALSLALFCTLNLAFGDPHDTDTTLFLDIAISRIRNT